MMKRFAIILAIVLLVTGCAGDNPPEKGDINLFYINRDATQVVPVAYDLKQGDEEKNTVIDEMISAMSGESGEVEYVSAIPQGIDIDSFFIRDDVLVLYFNEDYYTMDPVTEILCRLALVSTFCQLDGINGVEIYVNLEPLVDSKGDEVGVLGVDSFVENPGEQINSINKSTITLYFVNAEGSGLVREYRTVYYNSNIALEKIVAEQLLSGPRTDGLSTAIPVGTKLTSVTTVDGICYVSLDTGFKNQNYEIPEQIVIYSVVDTFCSLSNIDRVQISVNGDTSGVYRDSYELSKLYEADYDLVEEAPRQTFVMEPDAVQRTK